MPRIPAPFALVLFATPLSACCGPDAPCGTALSDAPEADGGRSVRCEEGARRACGPGSSATCVAGAWAACEPDPVEPMPDDEACDWHDTFYYDCTDLPDDPVEPCLDEEGSICDGRLHGAQVTQIVHGVGHACALFDHGRVKCWGNNLYGNLGLGHDAPRGDAPEHMGDALRYVDLGDDVFVEQISAGAVHTCALMASGRVKCWGGNRHGQLGLGDTAHRGIHRGEMGDNLPFVDLGHSRVVQVAAGSGHTCARFADDQIKCWGEGLWGILGNGSGTDRGDEPDEMGAALVAVDLGAEGDRVIDLATGLGRQTCALFESGGLKCWGTAGWGRLGAGRDVIGGIGHRPEHMGDNLPFVDVGTHERASAVAAGDRHVCALLAGGRMKCWGSNHSGQLGLGDRIDRGETPGRMGDGLPTIDVDDTLSVEAMALGNHFSCAILEGGWVKCWGQGWEASRGTVDEDDVGDEPGEMGAALPFLDLGGPAIELALGDRGGCALMADGAVKCWGAGDDGRLGTGNREHVGDDPGEMGIDMVPVDLGR